MPVIIEKKFVQWTASVLNTIEPEFEERIIKVSYAKFKNDPQEDFINLHEKLAAIYQHYLQKYTMSEFDIIDLNVGFFTIRLRKNKKSIAVAIIGWFLYTGFTMIIGVLIRHFS